MKEEGLDSIFKRHTKHMTATQEAMSAIGLKLFAKEGYGSPSITSVMANNDLDVEEIRKHMKSKFDILIAGGQDHLKGKIFRIGHLGFINDRDIITAVAALEASLDHMKSLIHPLGTGVSAAIRVLKTKWNLKNQLIN